MNKQRVAIIGGGIAGLVAANELLRRVPQIEISLYERSNNLGGRASTVRKDSFYLNQGAHALYNAGRLNLYLQSLGVTMSGAAPAQTNTLVYVSETFQPLSADLPFVEEIAKLDADMLLDIPLNSWLRDKFGSSITVQLVKSLVRLGTYSNAPEVVSAGRAVAQIQLGLAGVKYLNYGWQSIISSLRGLLPKPITEYTDSEVTAVSEQDDHVKVTARDITTAFDFVIFAVPPKVVEKLAPNVLGTEFVNSLVTSKIACLDVCLRSLPKPENTFVLSLDDPLYFSVHSATAKLSDQDQTVIHLGYYLRDGENGTNEHLKKMTDLLDRLQAGWRDELVYKRYLPNMVASYATPLASRNGVGGLPTPKLPGSSRMYAAGDWVGSGHLLADASAASALEAAHLIGGLVKGRDTESGIATESCIAGVSN